MRWIAAVILTLAACFPSIAQLPISGFPPGTFSGRAALDPAPTASTTTWNSGDTASTLSNGNLTATHASGSNTPENTRSISSASTGKKYFEITIVTWSVSAAGGHGLSNSSQSLTAFNGNSLDGVSWRDDGNVYINGGSIGTAVTWGTTGQVLCIATDIGAKLIWLRLNGGNWNNNGSADPATGTGGFDISTLNAGPYFPTTNLYSNFPDAVTANFGGTSYAQTVPSGYGNW